MTRRKVAKLSVWGPLLPHGGAGDPGQARPSQGAGLHTFGTVVDWRGSIIAEGMAWGKTKGIAVDWPRFADRWRDGYHPAMEKVRKGQLPGPSSITSTG